MSVDHSFVLRGRRDYETACETPDCGNVRVDCLHGAPSPRSDSASSSWRPAPDDRDRRGRPYDVSCWCLLVELVDALMMLSCTQLQRQTMTAGKANV